MSKLRFSFLKKEEKRPIKKECKIKSLIQDLIREGFPYAFASDLYDLSLDDKKVEHVLRHWKKEKDKTKRLKIVGTLQKMLKGKSK